MKMTIRQASVYSVVGCMLVSLAGCGKSGAKVKYDSPNAVFDAAKEAGKKKDFVTLCGCMTPDSHDVMAGTMIMAGGMMKAFGGMAAGFGGLAGADPEAKKKLEETQAKLAEIDKVMEKHGVTEEAMKKINPMQGPPENPLAAFKEMAAPIKNKPAFIGEMMQVMDTLNDGDPGGGRSPSEMFEGTLEEVKIDGDKATAVIVSTGKDKDRRDEVVFAKVDGGWLFDIVAVMENEMKNNKQGPPPGFGEGLPEGPREILPAEQDEAAPPEGLGSATTEAPKETP